MTLRVLTMPVPGHRRDTPRTAEPVTFGVPLPRGLVADPSAWRVRCGSKAWSGVQTRVLDRWVDGSARWVLVDAQVDLGLDGRDGLELDLAGGPSPSVSAITVTTDRQRVLVDSASTRFELRTGQSFPFSSITSAAGLFEARSSRLEAIGQSGVRHELLIGHLEVEDTGPLRVVVRMDGSIDTDGGRKIGVTARIHFFAGLSTVRLQVTVTNPNPAVHSGGFWDLGDPGSMLIRDLSIRLALTVPVAETVIACSPELGLPVAEAASPFELYQDSSGGEQWQSSNHINRERRIPVTFRGYRLRSGESVHNGLRATPIVIARQGGAEIGVAVPHFWQNFPRAIEASDASLTLRLFPGQFADLHELQGGEQKTHECWLSFGSDTVSAQPLDWCRSPTLTCIDPEWTLKSAAIPFLAPLGSDHAALVDAAIEGPDRFEQKREVIDEYGWRHFGEIYGDHESVRQKNPPLVSHYNNQFDPIAGFTLQYLRTADPRWWTMADELATHVVDIDIYHTGRDKSAYNNGLFWHTYHYGDADTATHRTYPASARGETHGGGPSADHNYTTGLLLHYYLTGCKRSWQTVVALGQYVIDLDDGRKTVFRWLARGDTGQAILSAGYYGPGRGPANSLNALLDAYRLAGDAAMLRKAEQIVRRVVHPFDDISRHRLDDPESRWFYTMFLQSLGKYLAFKAERAEFDDTYAFGRDALLHYARWMVEHEYPYLDKPEKLQFPTETWAAQDIRKSDVLYYASLHASNDERPEFEERAAFFHVNSVKTLSGLATRVLARPVIILLSSGFMHSWRQLNSEVVAPAPARQVDYGTPQPFEPQRIRAERRAKTLGATVAAVLFATLAWLMWRT
jgi:hypothetical protein